MNVVYLVIFLIANDGVTSQAIPQANLAQCQLNAKVFNRIGSNEILHAGYSNSTKTSQSFCIAGVK